MGRPPKTEIPTSAARLSVQLSPEAQQVFNEIMKAEGLKDRSETMDKIVLDYGEKVKGMEPAMLLKTKKGLTEVPKVERMSRDLEEADKELESALSTMVKQVRFKQLNKMLKDMEEKGSLDLEKLIMLGYVDKLMRESESGGGYGDLMPLFLFRMLGSTNGNQTMQNQMIQALKDEIKELKRDLQSKKGENPEIKRLEEMLRSLQEEKKFEKLAESIKAVAEKSKEKGDVEKLIPLITKLEEIRTKSESKAEKVKDEFQKFRDEILLKQIEELRKELGKDTISKKMRGKIEDILIKGFDKAVKSVAGEKSGAEIAKDLIEGTIEKIKEPVLKPIGEAVGKKIAAERAAQPMIVPVESIPQVQEVPQPEIQTPKSGKYSDLVNISTEKPKTK